MGGSVGVLGARLSCLSGPCGRGTRGRTGPVSPRCSSGRSTSFRQPGDRHQAGGSSPVRGVTSAEGVTGPYDVVALAEARNLNELGRRVMSSIQALEGAIRTLPCAVVRR